MTFSNAIGPAPEGAGTACYIHRSYAVGDYTFGMVVGPDFGYGTISRVSSVG